MRFNFPNFLIAALVVFACYSICEAGPKARRQQNDAGVMLAIATTKPVAGPAATLCGPGCPCGCDTTGRCDCAVRPPAKVVTPAPAPAVTYSYPTYPAYYSAPAQQYRTIYQPAFGGTCSTGGCR